MATSPKGLTALERKLWAQGWVSARMAAAKLACSVFTVHRLAYSERLGERDVMSFGRGRAKFFRLSALVAMQPPELARAFRLDDWRDVVGPDAYDKKGKAK